ATQAFTPLGGTTPHGALLGGMAPIAAAPPGHFGAFTLGADIFGSSNGAATLQYDELTEAGVMQIVSRSGPRVVSDASGRLSGTRLEVVGGYDQGDVVTMSWALET